MLWVGLRRHGLGKGGENGFAELPIRLQSGGARRRQRLGEREGNRLLHGDAVFVRAEEHGKPGGEGAGYGGIETDEDREPGGISEDLLCRFEGVGRKSALRVEDCGCGGLSLRVADVQAGGNGCVRVVGVGVVAFLRRHPEHGRRMPVQLGIFRIQ